MNAASAGECNEGYERSFVEIDAPPSYVAATAADPSNDPPPSYAAATGATAATATSTAASTDLSPAPIRYELGMAILMRCAAAADLVELLIVNICGTIFGIFEHHTAVAWTGQLALGIMITVDVLFLVTFLSFCGLRAEAARAPWLARIGAHLIGALGYLVLATTATTVSSGRTPIQNGLITFCISMGIAVWFLAARCHGMCTAHSDDREGAV